MIVILGWAFSAYLLIGLVCSILALIEDIRCAVDPLFFVTGKKMKKLDLFMLRMIRFVISIFVWPSYFVYI